MSARAQLSFWDTILHQGHKHLNKKPSLEKKVSSVCDYFLQILWRNESYQALCPTPVSHTPGINLFLAFSHSRAHFSFLHFHTSFIPLTVKGVVLSAEL